MFAGYTLFMPVQIKDKTVAENFSDFFSVMLSFL